MPDAKRRKPTGQTSERMRTIRALLERGWSRSSILSTLAARWRLSARQVDALLQRTYADLREEDEEARREARPKIRALTLAQYRAAHADGKHAAALRALELLAKLDGLDVSRVELTGADGGPVKVAALSVDLSRLSDEELAALGRAIGKATPKALAAGTPSGSAEGPTSQDALGRVFGPDPLP